MSDDDSAFEEFLGFSDLDSVGGKEGSDAEMHPEAVVVEMPKALLQNDTPQVTTASERSSTSSFFSVRKLGNLYIQPSGSATEKNSCVAPVTNKNDDSSSWSIVQGNTSHSIAGSSTISGFDVLSLNGGVQLDCKQCTFLNPDGHTLCAMCGLALSPNPCLDNDAQIAKSLQLKEENDAFKAVQLEEKKRKMLPQLTVLGQSQILTKDVLAFAEKYAEQGFSTIPEPSLVVLASRFIDCVREMNSQVTLAYHFSRNIEWRQTQIRQDGFGPHAQISKNASVAFKWYGNSRGSGKSRLGLTSIPEQSAVWDGNVQSSGRPGLGFSPSDVQTNDKPDDSSMEADFQGWIVATASNLKVPDTEYGVRAASGRAQVQVLQESRQSLPLVCFNPSLRETDSVRRLLNGLSIICNDFFHPSDDDLLQDCPLASPAKKPKHSEWESDDSLSAVGDIFEKVNIGPSRPARRSLFTDEELDYDQIFGKKKAKTSATTPALLKNMPWETMSDSGDSAKTI